MIQNQQGKELFVKKNTVFNFSNIRNVENYLTPKTIYYLSGFEFGYRRDYKSAAQLWKWIPKGSLATQPEFMQKQLRKYIGPWYWRKNSSISSIILAMIVGVAFLVHGYAYIMKSEYGNSPSDNPVETMKKSFSNEKKSYPEYQQYDKVSDHFMDVFYNSSSTNSDKKEFIKKYMDKSLSKLASSHFEDLEDKNVEGTIENSSRFLAKNAEYGQYYIENKVINVVVKDGNVAHVFGEGWETAEGSELKEMNAYIKYNDTAVINNFIGLLETTDKSKINDAVIKDFYIGSAVNSINSYQPVKVQMITKTYDGVTLPDKKDGVSITMEDYETEKIHKKYIVVLNDRHQITEIYGPSFTPIPDKYLKLKK